MTLTFFHFESVSVLRFIVSSRSRGEIGGEWVGVMNGMIASRSSGGGKKLLNGLNPGEKIALELNRLVLVSMVSLFYENLLD